MVVFTSHMVSSSAAGSISRIEQRSGRSHKLKDAGFEI